MSDLENGPHADDVLWAHEMSDPPEDHDSPYGHEHPLLDALAEWIDACDPFTMPLPPEAITDEMLLTLTKATRLLNGCIIDAVPYAQAFDNRDRWSRAYKIRAHIRDLTAQFLTGEYTDTNTDEPCDVEFNVTGLVSELVPGYERPDEIQPSYAGPIFYPAPMDDEGNVHDLDPHSRKV